MNSDDWKNWLIVIPARLGSTRLANKPLVDLCGKPLIVRVYERIKTMESAGGKVIVATDHVMVEKACKDHRVPVAMTSPLHPSGSDRVKEVAEHFDRPFVLNVQGDEPFVSVADLDALRSGLELSKQPEMATLCHESEDPEDYSNPNVVKVVATQGREALYFSRAAIPHYRNASGSRKFLKHLGVYAFERSTLFKFCALPPGLLETKESLEQLRALENGIKILLVQASRPGIGIDTPEDLERARANFRS
ncbi:MAG: 3-deoxy-manno-octulosonate cytidylyltransferase [Oligoflexales bacterium]